MKLADPASRLDSFLGEVRRAFDHGSFESLVLSKPRGGAAGDLKSVRVRRIGLRGGPALSFSYLHASRDVTRNVGLEEGLGLIAALLDPHGAPSLGHATLKDSGGSVQVLVSSKGQVTMRRLTGAPAQPASAARPSSSLEGAESGARVPLLEPHDRPRRRRLSLELPFVHRLGITDAAARLVPAMARKWRQIDKFLEVLDGALDAVPPGPAGESAEPAGAREAPLRVVDFGCGKGYLTFAVYEHLKRRFGIEPEVTGVELRPELVDFCNRAAAQCGYSGLRFVAGDLRSHQPGPVDVMIALHACDTATDHAIDLGLRAGAGVLVCSPCCHKELRPQMINPGPLAGVLRHGVHVGQEAEMVTDSLRALLLEASGYQARVFEFVSLEHTSKNKMILATRNGAGADSEAARALAQVGDVKRFYGIREQALEGLLRGRGLLPA